jgi:succinyl-CoA synthetase alpha subunit/pyrimidine deaminase RibD-like protein
MTDHVELRTGGYHDSVTLMLVSRQVAAAPGVSAAQVAMATELNLDVVRGMGFEVPDCEPNDLLVAVRSEDEAGVAAGLAALEDALAGLRTSGAGSAGGFGQEPPPRTLGRAVRRGGANLALVSVPGEHATTEALDALDQGVPVMVFSDNVSVEDEVLLKEAAAAREVLVMGPDCGTAVVGGVALGFANVVARGPVGIVAASGTGAQQVMALLDAAGVGVSHCLGVGGRDLSSAVAGRSTRQALAALAADEDTEVVVVVSKPPAADVLADLETYAAGLGVPVHWATLGAGRPDLTAAVESVLRAMGREVPTWQTWQPPTPNTSGARGARGARRASGGERYLRGLFCGGTLADEAMLVAGESLGPVRSNIPLSPELALGADLRDEGHLVIDFGDDALTRGRPHPMIDPSLRSERIATEAADTGCGVLLLDLVLGHGAHPDPGPELAEVVRAARQTAAADDRDLPVVVSLTGTAADPQDLTRTAQTLAGAGAQVFLSNAQAARHAVSVLAGLSDLPAVRGDNGAESRSVSPRIGEASATRPPAPRWLVEEPVVATAGVGLFADALRAQAVAVTEAQWQPPMDGTATDLARVMADPRRTDANALALQRMTEAGADLVDVRPASEALGLERGTFLHAGPPIEWERASGPLRGALIGAMLFEGLAETPEDAEARLARRDGITLEPCHHRGAVGPMAGVVSPSMWVYELRDEVHDHTSWSTLNEGLGKVLRYGAYGREVIDRLRWMNTVLGPLLQQAVKRAGGIDVKAIVAQMLQMGDEGHNRNRAGSLMLLRELVPHLIAAEGSTSDIAEAVRFSGANEHFFLNLGMPACKLSTLAAEGIPGSSVVTTMARNGTDFGIRTSGTGDQWFTGPANTPDGLFLGDYGPDDANPDIGDSAITETAGIGGFAMAAAPAIVRFVGGDVPLALRATRTMYEITIGEHPAYQVPILEFRGTPTGIDVALVARTGVLPQINTGMAGRVAGTGQVGAGLVTPPAECFTGALAALADAVPA